MRKLIWKVVDLLMATGCLVFLAAWGVMTVGATKGERLFGTQQEAEK